MSTPPYTLRTDTTGGWERVLFSELRGASRTPEAARVETILNLLVDANKFFRESIDPVPLHDRAAFLHEQQKRNLSQFAYHKTIEDLNDALSRYDWRSEIVGDLDGFHEVLRLNRRVSPGESTWEYAVVRLLLLTLKTPGELDRFRQCSDCRAWFFAASSHQRFCGEACRRHHAAASTEFKEKRRIYMQQVYRPQQKKRDARMKALANSPRPKTGREVKS